MAADPVHPMHDSFTDTGETALEWLRSHLPPDGDKATMDATDLRCIRQAIAGLMERDLLHGMIDDLCAVLRANGARGHHLAALALSIRDQRDALRAEIQRLRSALQTISDMGDDEDDMRCVRETVPEIRAMLEGEPVRDLGPGHEECLTQRIDEDDEGAHHPRPLAPLIDPANIPEDWWGVVMTDGGDWYAAGSGPALLGTCWLTRQWKYVAENTAIPEPWPGDWRESLYTRVEVVARWEEYQRTRTPQRGEVWMDRMHGPVAITHTPALERYHGIVCETYMQLTSAPSHRLTHYIRDYDATFGAGGAE